MSVKANNNKKTYRQEVSATYKSGRINDANGNWRAPADRDGASAGMAINGASHKKVR